MRIEQVSLLSKTIHIFFGIIFGIILLSLRPCVIDAKLLIIENYNDCNNGTKTEILPLLKYL